MEDLGKTQAQELRDKYMAFDVDTWGRLGITGVILVLLQADPEVWGIHVRVTGSGKIAGVYGEADERYHENILVDPDDPAASRQRAANEQQSQSRF